MFMKMSDVLRNSTECLRTLPDFFKLVSIEITPCFGSFQKTVWMALLGFTINEIDSESNA
jgi:hypothetical protein